MEEDLNKTLNSKKLSTTLKQKDIPALPPRQDYEAHNLNTYFIKVIEPIANRWFPFREFQKVLKSIGLNIFPEPDSDKFVTVTNKNKKLEWLTYRNMALCSCLLSFAFSKWNAEINDESKIVVSYQVHTQNKEPNSVYNIILFNKLLFRSIYIIIMFIKDRYKCMICTNEVFHLSESDENSEEINQNIMPETEVIKIKFIIIYFII